MTVNDLIAALQEMPGDAPVRVSVQDPNDTAWSNDVSVHLATSTEGRAVTVHGWVASDNDEAFAPWSQW